MICNNFNFLYGNKLYIIEQKLLSRDDEFSQNLTQSIKIRFNKKKKNRKNSQIKYNLRDKNIFSTRIREFCLPLYDR